MYRLKLMGYAIACVVLIAVTGAACVLVSIRLARRRADRHHGDPAMRIRRAEWRSRSATLRDARRFKDFVNN